MLRVCWNWRFFYLTHRLGIMASWKSLAKGIKGHWHHLIPRLQIELEQHNIVPWAWAGVFRNGICYKVIRSFSWLIFLILTAGCEICIRSHWAKKLVYGLIQWDDPLAMDMLCRGIPNYYAMLWVWWNWRFFLSELPFAYYGEFKVACKRHLGALTPFSLGASNWTKAT